MVFPEGFHGYSCIIDAKAWGLHHCVRTCRRASPWRDLSPIFQRFSRWISSKDIQHGKSQASHARDTVAQARAEKVLWIGLKLCHNAKPLWKVSYCCICTLGLPRGHEVFVLCASWKCALAEASKSNLMSLCFVLIFASAVESPLSVTLIAHHYTISALYHLSTIPSQYYNIAAAGAVDREFVFPVCFLLLFYYLLFFFSSFFYVFVYLILPVSFLFDCFCDCCVCVCVFLCSQFV